MSGRLADVRDELREFFGSNEERRKRFEGVPIITPDVVVNAKPVTSAKRAADYAAPQCIVDRAEGGDSLLGHNGGVSYDHFYQEARTFSI